MCLARTRLQFGSHSNQQSRVQKPATVTERHRDPTTKRRRRGQQGSATSSTYNGMPPYKLLQCMHVGCYSAALSLRRGGPLYDKQGQIDDDSALTAPEYNTVLRAVSVTAVQQ